MPASSVSIVLRVRKADGTRAHYSAVMNTNGRLKPHWGVVNGTPTHLPGSVYYLRYREGDGKRVWEHVGSDPGAALTAKQRREHVIAGVKLGLEASGGKTVTLTHGLTAPVPPAARLPLLATIHAHCRNISITRSEKTARGYQRDLTSFAICCGKHFLDELTRQDVQAWIVTETQQGMAPKTVENRLTTLRAFLRKHGYDGKIIVTSDAPRVHKKLPHVYGREQVRTLLEASNGEDRLIWEVFLAAGLREQELSHLVWEDVNFERGLLHLHAKPDLGFYLKDAEERQIPMPRDLMQKLRVRRAASPEDRLVFPTGQGTVEGHLLRRLKELVFYAGLNCGRCVNKKGQSCAAKPVCANWTLHSFRRTAATRWHEAGLSVPTVQRLLGHSDIETTMSYLGCQDLDATHLRDAIDGVFSAMAA